MKLLNIRIPNQRFPTLIIQIYYLMIAITFTYLYYHKFIQGADFYSPLSTGGLYAVVNLESARPIQFRILLPFIFKGLTMLNLIPDKPLFFLINAAQTYLILLSFYFLLNRYFQSKAMNCWLAPVIIYPMIWNLVILNGQFFFMDFTILLIIVTGFYFIVSERYNWLLIVFLTGVLNHPSVGYLIIAFLLYNYRRLFNVKTILYAAAMAILYIGIYRMMDAYFPKTEGYFIIYNMPRNLSLFSTFPPHIILRDIFFNFGGLHFFIIIFLISGVWKRYRGQYIYVNLVCIPYLATVLINFSIEEMRNYVTIIPFVVILCLLFLSTFPNSFLRPQENILTQADNK